ncbi:YcnI family copper-binding membrane protein [Microbacterium sp. JZ31]|uniref:YcnI family copper-binding membrane protein n=1 Tax=Microbacterium sp. JZ31 TaxID=1906274 RepID=UPI0019339F0E|nr:YcnI family protein [Microbacterium sp. JZ31]
MPFTHRTRIAAGVTLAAGLVLAAPLAASAHVTVTPDAPAVGGYDVLTFAFGHGCDGSPTTALRIDMPDGLDSVTPTIAPGWAIDVERDASNGLVTQVTYTADEPVADDRRATIELGVKYAEDAADTLAFPVEQVCVDGATSWSEIAADGEDPHALDHPAPTVTLGEATSAEHGASASHDTEAAPAEAAAPAADPLPVALGAGGLVAGVAALVVSLLAWRRARR